MSHGARGAAFEGATGIGVGEAKAWILGRRDRMAIEIWLFTRILVVFVSLLAARLMVKGDLQDSFLDRWTQWDVDHFVEIARFGYGGDPAQPYDPGLPAFFPGFPLLLRAVHLVVPDWRAAALLLSLVAGAVATVALARIADLPEARSAAGRPGTVLEGTPDAAPEGTQEVAPGDMPEAAPGAAPEGARDGTPGAASGGTPDVAPETASLRRDPGLWSVTALLLSPMAVFLFAGYTEAVFLALALPAWLYARRGRWAAAAVCCAAAGSVRITGLFLAVALIVEFATGRHGARARRWRSAVWLPVAFLGPAAYGVYLWWRTGDPQAWQHAQEAGWGRGMVAPWEAFKTTWSAAFEIQNQFTGAFRVELVAALVGVLLVVWLLARRRWAESTYVGLQLVALLTSSFYLSVGRATLLWWPLWIAVGGLAARRPWVGVPLIAAGSLFLSTQIVTFTAGEWTG